MGIQLMQKRGVLQIDPSLLQGPYAEDIEIFRSDFQWILGQAGLDSEYVAKMNGPCRCKADDKEGITLGASSAYAIEAVYVFGGKKYIWNISFPQKDTTLFHENLQKVLRGETISPPVEPLPQKVEEFTSDEDDASNQIIFRDPIVAAQAFLFMWVMADDGDFDLSSASITCILMKCYQQSAVHKVSAFHQVLKRQGFLKSTGYKLYRPTTKAFEYIQVNLGGSERIKKMRELEDILLEELKSDSVITGELKAVRAKMIAGLSTKIDAQLRNKQQSLKAKKEYLKQAERALLRLRNNFIHA